LSPVDKAQGKTKSGDTRTRRGQGRKLQNQQKMRTWKICHEGPP
jgi:hypothetical protein